MRSRWRFGSSPTDILADRHNPRRPQYKYCLIPFVLNAAGRASTSAGGFPRPSLLRVTGPPFVQKPFDLASADPDNSFAKALAGDRAILDPPHNRRSRNTQHLGNGTWAHKIVVHSCLPLRYLYSVRYRFPVAFLFPKSSMRRRCRLQPFCFLSRSRIVVPADTVIGRSFRRLQETHRQKSAKSQHVIHSEANKSP